MKIWKLVSGIMSIVFSVVVCAQSFAAGIYNSLADTGEVSGSAGLIVAVFLLAGGSVSIATHASDKKGGSIACLIVFVLAALMGYTMTGHYTDLNVWATWCLICAVMALIALFARKKPSQNPAA